MEEPVYLRELAEILDRKPHSIREWIRQEALPKKLMPFRDGGRRQLAWHRDQIPGLKKFAEERVANQGWGHQQAGA